MLFCYFRCDCCFVELAWLFSQVRLFWFVCFAGFDVLGLDLTGCLRYLVACCMLVDLLLGFCVS